MNALLKMIAELLGEGWTDETRAKVEEAAKAANTSAAAAESDGIRAELKRAKTEGSKASKRADLAEAKLKDASGDTDERLGELRTALDESRGKVSELETEATRRTLRSRVKRVLRGAEIPEDRREAALDLISLDGVEIDDEADTGLAGANGAVESLRSRYPFLWETATEQGNGSGHGGKRGGSAPPPKPPAPQTKTAADYVREAVAGAYESRGLRTPEVRT